MLFLMARYSDWVHGWVVKLGERWPLCQEICGAADGRAAGGPERLTSLRSFWTGLFWMVLSLGDLAW